MNNKINNNLSNTTLGWKYGIIAGIAMTAILFLFQLSGLDYSPMAKLSKYIALFLVITYGLYKVISNLEGKNFFQGVVLGNKMSIAAGIILLISTILIYSINPEYAFSKYSLVPDSIFQAVTIGIILFFETFIFGNIITFISMQYFKNPPSY